jgi:hypothetical protein
MIQPRSGWLPPAWCTTNLHNTKIYIWSYIELNRSASALGRKRFSYLCIWSVHRHVRIFRKKFSDIHEMMISGYTILSKIGYAYILRRGLSCPIKQCIRVLLRSIQINCYHLSLLRVLFYVMIFSSNDVICIFPFCSTRDIFLFYPLLGIFQ